MPFGRLQRETDGHIPAYGAAKREPALVNGYSIGYLAGWQKESVTVSRFLCHVFLFLFL